MSKYCQTKQIGVNSLRKRDRQLRYFSVLKIVCSDGFEIAYRPQQTYAHTQITAEDYEYCYQDNIDTHSDNNFVFARVFSVGLYSDF